ncbi:hypothetical protein HK405_001642 [Cladochytrium tenue]|nr:hypothetical protein HK405_001642 [Cladochytrium tenue]
MHGAGAGAGARASSLNPFLQGLNLPPRPASWRSCVSCCRRFRQPLDAMLVPDMLMETLKRSARSGHLAVALVVLNIEKLAISELVRWRDNNIPGVDDRCRRSRSFRLGIDRALKKAERDGDPLLL